MTGKAHFWHIVADRLVQPCHNKMPLFINKKKKNLNDIVNAFTQKVTDDLELAFAFYKVFFFIFISPHWTTLKMLGFFKGVWWYSNY